MFQFKNIFLPLLGGWACSHFSFYYDYIRIQTKLHASSLPITTIQVFSGGSDVVVVGGGGWVVVLNVT